MSWQEFWNADTPIYVNARHRALHYARVAQDIARLVPPGARVLDFGCGEAQAADVVAGACGRLYLCDSAALARSRLSARFAGAANITVLSPEEAAALPDGVLDLIVVNSVIQYLRIEDLRALLRAWRGQLAPGGRLVLADVLPEKTSAWRDAAALLSFALRGGFFWAAIAGLARTAVSDYARLRRELGLLKFDEAAMLALLRESGFAARRFRPNLGGNQARMAFEAHAVSAGTAGTG